MHEYSQQVLTGTAKNDKVSKTRNLTTDATFVATCCTCWKDRTSTAPCLMHRNLLQLPGECLKLWHWTPWSFPQISQTSHISHQFTSFHITDKIQMKASEPWKLWVRTAALDGLKTSRSWRLKVQVQETTYAAPLHFLIIWYFKYLQIPSNVVYKMLVS